MGLTWFPWSVHDENVEFPPTNAYPRIPRGSLPLFAIQDISAHTCTKFQVRRTASLCNSGVEIMNQELWRSNFLPHIIYAQFLNQKLDQRKTGKHTLYDYDYIFSPCNQCAFRESPHIGWETDSGVSLTGTKEDPVQPRWVTPRKSVLNSQVNCCFFSSCVEATTEDKIASVETKKIYMNYLKKVLS